MHNTELLQEILKELKGLRMDFKAQTECVTTTIDLIGGAITRLPSNCFKGEAFE